MEADEVLSNPFYYALCGIGMVAVVIMLVVLKGMGSSEIMPTWVKLVTFISIPVISFVFMMLFGE
jgi:hypothetical protein